MGRFRVPFRRTAGEFIYPIYPFRSLLLRTLFFKDNLANSSASDRSCTKWCKDGMASYMTLIRSLSAG